MDAMLRELDGLRVLARALVHGDGDTDDLVQDTALAVLTARPHGSKDTGTGAPVDDRPARPWLAAILRNRWRMDRRSASRRLAREQLSAASDEATAGTAAGAAIEAIDRARSLEKLAAALVALDEPYRTAVIRRYLDGQTAAQLARELGVPPGTVRWRLKTGLDRLRAALDDSAPRWQRALVPLLGATVKTKTSISVAVIVILLLGVGGGVWLWHNRGEPAQQAAATSTAHQLPSAPHAATASRSAAIPAAKLHEPQPAQGRAIVEPTDAEGGVLSGRVINWSRGDGVAGAELTFTGSGGDGAATTVRSHDDGGFELAPAAPGRFTLTAVAAPGYLPYAPELAHSTVRVALAKGEAVRGITIFLFPALDYRGTVVDAHGGPVASATVRLLDAPAGEQVIDRPATEWTSDRDGHFTFHAADGAVLEAVRGNTRGWGVLDGDVAITHQLTIRLGDGPARDAVITGRVVDDTGAPVGDVLVRAEPEGSDWPMPTGLPPRAGVARPAQADPAPRSGAAVTTGPDGSFALARLDRKTYQLSAQAEDGAPTVLAGIAGGSQQVQLVVDAGRPLAGQVIDGEGKPAPAFTLLVFRREGAGRTLLIARSVVDPHGQFAIRVGKGDYELIASANGWAPSAPTHATAGASDVVLTLSQGATLRGQIVAADSHAPIPNARVMRESRSGGASAQPANAGTVTRDDGTFELTGIPAGPLSVTIGAGEFHPKIEAGMTAVDGQTLGPMTFALNRLLPGEEPKLELVGIGVGLAADGDALKVNRVLPGGGAEAAGIVEGDRIIAIDGGSVVPLGVDGAVARIRGVEGTTVSITLQRNDQPVVLVVIRRKLHA